MADPLPAARIAYIISAYKLPEQVVRLVHRLQTGTSSFFVHVDKKSDDAIFQHISDQLADVENVYFLKRHTCYWGGFGHVAATLEGITALLRAAVPFDYLVLLTGQDYPIKPNTNISRFFLECSGKLFMDYAPLPHPEWEYGGMDRVWRWHLYFRHRHYGFPPSPTQLLRRRPPAGLRLFGGSSYWCLTRELIEYIAAFLARQRQYVRFFKFVDVPDELFFHTIILNSPLRHQVVNDNLRYIDWKDEHAASPAVLTTADFGKLASSPKLFARKFDITVDAAVLDLIDEKLLRP